MTSTPQLRGLGRNTEVARSCTFRAIDFNRTCEITQHRLPDNTACFIADTMQTTMMRPAGFAARLPVRAPSQSCGRVRQRLSLRVRAEETTTEAPATSTPPLDNSQPKPQLDSYSVRLRTRLGCHRMFLLLLQLQSVPRTHGYAR